MVNEYQQRITAAIKRLKESSIVEDGNITGCAKDEISEIEQKAGVDLPTAYVMFLEEMGQSAGDFQRGDDLFYPDMIGLQSAMQEIIAEKNSSVELTGSDFVFAGHHGYVYLLFDTQNGEDPPVYRYIEGNDELEQVFEGFSEWLESSIEDEISLADY